MKLNAPGDKAAEQGMRIGPHFDTDRPTLLRVPARLGWYNAEANAAWAKVGFAFRGEEWVRDVSQPLGGKRYQPEVWLRSTRKRFYTLYPQLKA